MDSIEIVVLVAGVLLIALVLWYFFADRGRDVASEAAPPPRSRPRA